MNFLKSNHVDLRTVLTQIDLVESQDNRYKEAISLLEDNRRTLEMEKREHERAFGGYIAKFKPQGVTHEFIFHQGKIHHELTYKMLSMAFDKVRFNSKFFLENSLVITERKKRVLKENSKYKYVLVSDVEVENQSNKKILKKYVVSRFGVKDSVREKGDLSLEDINTLICYLYVKRRFL